jgi:succinate dehydrogenase / fumarate reductase membrane anchor subunit
MSVRSPLRRVLGLGSAKDGSSHWISQRATAVALVILGAWFFLGLASLPAIDHEAVVAWLGSPVSAVLAVLLVAVAGHHANLGLQVVVEDYVASHTTRLALLLAVKFALAAATLTGVLAVVRIASGVPA